MTFPSPSFHTMPTVGLRPRQVQRESPCLHGRSSVISGHKSAIEQLLPGPHTHSHLATSATRIERNISENRTNKYFPKKNYVIVVVYNDTCVTVSRQDLRNSSWKRARCTSVVIHSFEYHKGDSMIWLSSTPILLENTRDSSTVGCGHGSLVTKVAHSWPVSHEFKPSTVEDPSVYEGVTSVVTSVEAQTSSR
ncbi:hypothetical protein TNCV_193071 [Trichonephila clavipes]|nr:hypothetical protein TNCV_193071 [Trichonephila clavipes]